ncbi:SIR2 family NAD-dependent protein deacylase [Tumebacillus lipolyticus]|uniref:SIR2 family protein n=1 Tax=Tumebacillus lipolyticus TaxID=1280370 RepID=A0ABW4ZX34_9BACL
MKLYNVETKQFKWPESLVTEIAERRCIIVLGAGASASSTNELGNRPKDWSKFLRVAIRKMNDSQAQLLAIELCDKGLFLDAAQIIHDHIDPGDFDQVIQQEFNPNIAFQPSDLHRNILSLDPKIVITTNYDKIYESLCNLDGAGASFNTLYYYSSNLLSEIRSKKRLIIKAHGCVNDSDKIVLTRKSYFDAKNDYPSFYKILDSLFLINTVLFIGCSMSDPDINLLLEGVNISAKSSRSHYAISGDGRPISIKNAIKTTYNLELLEYPEGEHHLVIDALEDLVTQVWHFRETGGHIEDGEQDESE